MNRNEGVNYKTELKGEGKSNNYVFLLYSLYCQIMKHSRIYIGYGSVQINQLKKSKKQASGRPCKKRVYICISILIIISYEEYYYFHTSRSHCLLCSLKVVF